MKKFDGFSENETFTRLPDTFFQQILNEIDDLTELKVMLYVFWRIAHIEGAFRAIRRSDIEQDEHFMHSIVPEALSRALESAVWRGVLLWVADDSGGCYFLNSPLGRASAEAFAKVQPDGAARSTPAPLPRPNIFKLYEENIGPLTPLIADALKDAEREYSPEWIAGAMIEAVKRNKRSWKYVEAILKRWKQDGKYEGKNRTDASESTERYSKSAFSEYIQPD